MEAVGQIKLFPRSTQRSETVRRFDTVLVVGMADGLNIFALPATLVAAGADLGLRYLAEWELKATGIEPDLMVEELPPSMRSRRVVARTLADEIVEQDDAGWLWVDDVRLDFGPLVSFGSADSAADQQLELGERAAWLLGDCADKTFGLQVRTSGPLLWIFDQPHALGGVGVFAGWLNPARHLSRRAWETDSRFSSGASTSDDPPDDQHASPPSATARLDMDDSDVRCVD